MSDSLDNLGGILTKYNLENELDREKEVANRLYEVHTKLRRQLQGKNAELDESEKEQVRNAFEQVVREDIEEILSGDFGIKEFSGEIESIIEDLEDILRSPQAEAVVENILSWLLSTGLQPLSDEKQNELRDVVKEDLEAARQAVHDARSAHDNLRGYLGEAQEEIDQMILEEIENTSSVSDLESLAEGLQRLDNSWKGDWKLEYTTEAGETLYQELLDLLEQNLTKEVTSQKNINSLAAILENKSGRWKRNLETIDEAWSKIETRVGQIEPPDGSFEASDALSLAQNSAGPVMSLNTYQSSLKATAEKLSDIREVSQTDIEKYSVPDSSHPEEISDQLTTVEERMSETEAKYKDVFTADKTSDIEDTIKAFKNTFNKLDKAFQELRQTIVAEIETTRRLAIKFELKEQQQDLNGLYTTANSADTTAVLIETFADYKTTAEEVREPVREKLSEDEEEIFTFLLENEPSEEESIDTWDAISENIDQDRPELLKNIDRLEQKGLLEVRIWVD